MSSPVPSLADTSSMPEPGRWAGYVTAVCAFLFAVSSFYWGFGGTFLLDTVGSEAVRLVEEGNVGIYVAVWFAGFVKVAGGVLALALVQPWGRRLFRHWMLLIAGWGAAVALVLYGGVQIGIQLMVLGGILVPPGGMDWRGFYGHLYVWDPWFIVWGLFMGITAFYYTRNARRRRALGTTA
ncbi:hypothetical protein F4560_003483 [Saccharothrix ecbatanensis]|uniref:DUF3995 domain-containing protein n=1 Tax=Saccharothrix ecbatanensis TaxID=1105145 RepID=A0A7W9HK61_9PSEU|nr:DUF3995 domain-containing protein [Saccharothrix ecbatanensis]MBB5803715.1 hypothetical protein [Saccharothrix ecbatanensis]